MGSNAGPCDGMDACRDLRAVIERMQQGDDDDIDGVIAQLETSVLPWAALQMTQCKQVIQALLWGLQLTRAQKRVRGVDARGALRRLATNFLTAAARINAEREPEYLFVRNQGNEVRH